MKGEGMRETIPEDLDWLYDRANWDEARIEYTRRHKPQSHEITPTLVSLIERIAKVEARNEVLEEALRRVRAGVMLMVPEPRKGGFLEILDAALREDR